MLSLGSSAQRCFPSRFCQIRPCFVANFLQAEQLASIQLNQFSIDFWPSAFVIADVAICAAAATVLIGSASAFQPEMAQSDGLNRKLPFLDRCLFHRTMRVLEI